MVIALLVTPDIVGLQWRQQVEAQTLKITIPVYDYTRSWRSTVQAGVARWDAALAPRGIRLTYSPENPTDCEGLVQPASGISACDSALNSSDERWADGEEQGIWVENGVILVRGMVRFYEDAPDTDFADKVICHELGHTLQLSHVREGSDSCMTPIPARGEPSNWDAANALSFIPEIPTLTPPAPGDDNQDKEKKEKKQKKRDKKEKKHQKVDGGNHKVERARLLQPVRKVGHGKRN
jgi:hypothetical protein